MNAQEWLVLIVVGALLGATGQGARVVVGIKKLCDVAEKKDSSVRSLMVPSQLATSLLIGAIAGVIGVLSTGIDATQPLPAKDLVTLLFIGYAGTDFIEGFIRRETPKLPLAGAAGPPGPSRVETIVSPLPGAGPTLATGPQIVVSTKVPGDSAVG